MAEKWTSPRPARERLLRRVAAAVAAAISLAVLAGCGEGFPDTVRVRGKVTYQDEPLSEGTIAFHPAGPHGERLYRPAVGVIADGAYQLQSFRHGDGVMPGEYAVVIESYEGGPTAEDPDRPQNWLIPRKYGNPATSGLTATIPAGASGRLELDFDLQ